eukprot:7090751-Alexandrium_andersonii.AAC.1
MTSPQPGGRGSSTSRAAARPSWARRRPPHPRSSPSPGARGGWAAQCGQPSAKSEWWATAPRAAVLPHPGGEAPGCPSP